MARAPTWAGTALGPTGEGPPSQGPPAHARCQQGVQTGRPHCSGLGSDGPGIPRSSDRASPAWPRLQPKQTGKCRRDSPADKGSRVLPGASCMPSSLDLEPEQKGGQAGRAMGAAAWKFPGLARPGAAGTGPERPRERDRASSCLASAEEGLGEWGAGWPSRPRTEDTPGSQPPPSRASSAFWPGPCPRPCTCRGQTLGKGLEGPVSERASAGHLTHP